MFWKLDCETMVVIGYGTRVGDIVEICVSVFLFVLALGCYLLAPLERIPLGVSVPFKA